MTSAEDEACSSALSSSDSKRTYSSLEVNEAKVTEDDTFRRIRETAEVLACAGA
jgi:hypothetical protein